MAYTPPSWNAVDFGASGEGYTPPAWGEVKFPAEPGFIVLTGSTTSFAGASPIEQRAIATVVGSVSTFEGLAVVGSPTTAWANPWSATGTAIDWKSRAEMPRDFSCPAASSVSWNASFQYVSELVSPTATAIDWRSSFSVVPHNVLKQGSIDLSLKSAVAWKSSFAAPAEFIRDNASKTTLAFVAGFEKPVSFSMKPGSIASWKGRFHYPSTFSMTPATTVVWRSSSSGYSNPCCMQPVACRLPVYATAARFVVTCKSRLCLRS